MTIWLAGKRNDKQVSKHVNNQAELSKLEWC